ncbi:MAG: rhodanese-like domain-containing protein [Halothiobacillaceae bacterium]|nr:MAG: rhodanese-like domain-containing protein [Halothiobacillaceae bacterium]
MYSIEQVDARELSTWLKAEKFLLVDVRTPGETTYGIIPGAKLLPLHLLPLNVDTFKGQDKIVIYCQSGARSAQACAFLSRQGIEHTYNLGGGIMSWAGERLPIVAPDADSTLV